MGRQGDTGWLTRPPGRRAKVDWEGVKERNKERRRRFWRRNIQICLQWNLSSSGKERSATWWWWSLNDSWSDQCISSQILKKFGQVRKKVGAAGQGRLWQCEASWRRAQLKGIWFGWFSAEMKILGFQGLLKRIFLTIPKYSLNSRKTIAPEGKKK